MDELEFVSTQGNTVCIGDGGDVTQHDDAACATTNSLSDLTNTPWAYRAKDSKFANNVMPKQSFFEGGIDITELVGEVCFSSYLAETRSSHSETAELKDFALGAFELCGMSMNKDCIADNVEPYLSPVYNATTNLYETVHTISITNDGAGTLHDVQVQDSTIGTDLSCQITGVTFSGGTGTAASPALTLPFTIPNGTAWTEVANTLGKDATARVELFCTSTTNKKQNTASARAAAAEGGSLTVDAGPDAETADDVADCNVTLNATLQLNKFCATEASDGNVPNPLFDPAVDLVAVTLNPNNGFNPTVCVDVRVANNSTPAQRVVIDSLVDVEGFLPDGNDPGGDPDPVLYDMLNDFKAANDLNGSDCDNTTGNAIVDCNTLLPNEVVAFARCYDTVGPDNGETIPGLATYSDEVTVDAHGVAGGTITDLSDTATCPLCPQPAPD
jgi:hypothetical protein